MIPSVPFKLYRLKTYGRLAYAALQAVGGKTTQALRRFDQLWLKALRGELSPQQWRLLEKDGNVLKAAVETLPEAERYEAAMALHIRGPRGLALDPELLKTALGAVAKLSKILDPDREKLVAGVAKAVHNSFDDLVRRAGKGVKLQNDEQAVLDAITQLRKVAGTEYDNIVTELARESVRLLREDGSKVVKRVSTGKVSNLQGAVAQFAFFAAREFKLTVVKQAKAARQMVARFKLRGWAVSALTEGRIYLVRRLPSGGYAYFEFVDGAVLVAERAAGSAKLPRGFLHFAAQVKAEQKISALPQQLQDLIRTTPDFGDYGPVLLHPSGKGYKAVQLVAPPVNWTTERVAIAAEGGVWPDLNIPQPTSVGSVGVMVGPMSRDQANALARRALNAASAALRAAP